VIGQWSGPHDLGISCTEDDCLVDEIGHATLIPCGDHAGRVLFWTRCHDSELRDTNCLLPKPYSSHILETQTMTIQESPTFDTAYPISPRKDGPFCSGHIWILDGNGDPKFLAVGGVDFDVTQGASRETFWFDPNAAGPQHWFDGPGPLPVLEQYPGGGDQVGSWYPTVMTFLDPVAARFRAIAIGGTSLRSAECVDDARYGGWWTLSMNGVWSAVTNSDGYEWPWYPRSHLLHTASGEGEILTAGIDNVDGCTNQEPCHKIVTHSPTQTHQVFASQPGGVGMWNTNNTVLMHTLAPGWVWAPGDALSHYLLNRVIGTMGTSGPGAAPVLAETRELVNGSWVEKADASTARYFSNAVLLPDGSVLVVGGQSNKAKGGNTTTVYWSAADRFVPGQPSTLGSWTTLATTSRPSGAEDRACLKPWKGDCL